MVEETVDVEGERSLFTWTVGWGALGGGEGARGGSLTCFPTETLARIRMGAVESTFFNDEKDMVCCNWEDSDSLIRASAGLPTSERPLLSLARLP